MNRTGAQAAESLQVLPGGIPLMRGEAVARMLRVLFRHQPVPGDLGDYRRRRYRQALAVSLDDGLVRDAALRKRHGVDEEEAGSPTQGARVSPSAWPLWSRPLCPEKSTSSGFKLTETTPVALYDQAMPDSRM